MEGTSNGGLLYHEVQESKLCAVHCVNTVLQGPFFSEFDLAALASDLDRKELQMMLQGGTTNTSGNFLSEESHNVSLEGDFSIQVLQKALEVWDLQVIPFDCPVAEAAQIDPELENAFICHLHNHWFCIRKVNGGWYNFDSLYAAPQNLSKFYLSAYLDTLRGSGWSIFLVRGNFPKECPMLSSETSNGYGQWLTPEDADRINKSCNSTQAAPQGINPIQPSDPHLQFGAAGMFSDAEDEDLKAAIAASLMDSSPATATAGTTPATVSASSTPATTSAGATPAMAGDGTTLATACAGATPATACAGTTPAMAADGATASAGTTPATVSAGTTPQDENENSTTPQGENQSSEDKIAKE